MFRKSVDKFLISHQNFLITLHIFRSLSVILSASAQRQRCINTCPLEFEPFVSDFVGNCELPTNADGLYPSVEPSVIMVFPQLSMKCRWTGSVCRVVSECSISSATLYEMPTDYIC